MGLSSRRQDEVNYDNAFDCFTTDVKYDNAPNISYNHKSKPRRSKHGRRTNESNIDYGLFYTPASYPTSSDSGYTLPCPDDAQIHQSEKIKAPSQPHPLYPETRQARPQQENQSNTASQCISSSQA